MRYCPPYVAPSKAGRPKNEKRLKSFLEGGKKKKKKSLVETMEQESKKAKTIKKKTGGK